MLRYYVVIANSNLFYWSDLVYNSKLGVKMLLAADFNALNPIIQSRKNLILQHFAIKSNNHDSNEVFPNSPYSDIISLFK